MRSNAPDSPLSALLLSPCPPDEGQKLRMEQVLAKRFGCPVTLTWQEDRTTGGGPSFPPFHSSDQRNQTGGQGQEGSQQGSSQK